VTEYSKVSRMGNVPMGDKSPKAAHKQSVQKQAKAANVKRDKDAATVAAATAADRNGKK